MTLPPAAYRLALGLALIAGAARAEAPVVIPAPPPVATPDPGPPAASAPVVLTPAQFGARCDSTGEGSTGTDDTAAFQAAIAAAEARGGRLRVEGSATMCRLTAPLLIRRHLMIEGDYCQPVRHNDGVAGTPGRGSWLYFDHPGRGIVIDDGPDSQVTGVVLADLCTIRNQPAPVAQGAWAPLDHDFDIYFAQDDLTLRNVMLLNPTRGVFSSGRLLVQGLHGQPMRVGLAIDDTHDTDNVSDLHWWPYWADNKAVERFTRGAMDGIVLGRVDNPNFSNISMIAARDCFRLIAAEGGVANKVHGVNIDCDLFGHVGWLVDGAEGATWQLANFTGQGDDDLLSRHLVSVSGRDNVGTFTNTRGTLLGREGVKVEGRGNDLTFTNLRLERWGQRQAGAALRVSANNSVTLDGSFQPAGSPKDAAPFAGRGNVYQSTTVNKGGASAD